MTTTVTREELVSTAEKAAKKAIKSRGAFIAAEDITQTAILAVLENPRSSAPFNDAYRAAMDYIARNYDHKLAVSRDMRMGFAKTQELVRTAVANGMTQNEALAAYASEKNDHAGVTAETYLRLDRQYESADTEDGDIQLRDDQRFVDDTASGALDAKRAISGVMDEGTEVEQRVLAFALNYMTATGDDELPSLRTIAAGLGVTKHAVGAALKTIRARMEWAR